MTASEKACSSQGTKRYPGVDAWQDSPLYKGNIVYVWESENQTGHYSEGTCAMTPETAFGCEGDPNALRGSIQTDLNPDYPTHRGVLRAYEINGDVDAAFSHCEANTCHGSGGGEQYYIPDFDKLQEQGLISRRDDLDLHFSQDKLGIDQEEINRDSANTKQQSDESPVLKDENGINKPSEETTSTLDGAYTGETPGLADELKTRKEAESEKWDNGITNGESNQTETNGNPDGQENKAQGNSDEQGKQDQGNVNSDEQGKQDQGNGNSNKSPQSSNNNNDDYDYYNGIF